MTGLPLPDDDRAAISYVDVVLTFATMAMIAVTAPMWFTIFEKIQGVADPLTVALVNLGVPLLLIGLVISIAVAARS